MSWPVQRLGDICSVSIGRTPSRSEASYWGGPGIWLTVGELNGQVLSDSKEKISEKALKEVMPPPVQPGTLLFSFKLSIGKMAVAGVPLHTNEAIAALPIRDPNVLDREFLRYALLAQNSAAGASHAVLGLVLNKAKVEALNIPVPPFPEQRRIVDILARAEGLVRLHRQAADKLREVVSALFLEMFGDPATNPKGWPAVTLSEVGSLDRGRSRNRPRDAAHLYGGPYPFVQTGDIANSPGRLTSFSQTYSEAGLAQSRLWPRGTLCITIAANIANTAILDIEACFPDSVVGFNAGDTVTTEYVQSWLGFLQPVLEAAAPQAAQKNINLEILRGLGIPLPPLALQARFTEQVQLIGGLRDQTASALATAQAAFDALLHRFFNGCEG